MAGITYTAKREIITLNFAFTAENDISASSTDDSFNSTSTDLSGLADGDWIYVSGFSVNDENNGWHQITGTPSSSKIQVTSTLVTEAAGDNISMQGYDHGLNQDYNIDLTLRHFLRRAKTNKSIIEPILGDFSVLRYSKHYYWDCVTRGIALASMATYREFFGSVDAGETFTFDPRGTIASPSNPVTVQMITDSYTEEPVTGDDAYFSIGFTVRETTAAT